MGAGLYPKEAAAMLETWRDSWFEEGTRIFYIVPRATVDALLPLTVTPAPTGMARVFAGRVEVLSPYVRQTLAGAFATGDVAKLERYGRFLRPLADELMRHAGFTESPEDQAFLLSKEDAALGEASAPTCVR